MLNEGENHILLFTGNTSKITQMHYFFMQIYISAHSTSEHTVLFIKNWTTNGGQTGGQSTDVHRTVADVRRTDDRPIIITSFLRIDIGSPESVSRARMAYFRNVK